MLHSPFPRVVEGGPQQAGELDDEVDVDVDGPGLVLADLKWHRGARLGDRVALGGHALARQGGVAARAARARRGRFDIIVRMGLERELLGRADTALLATRRSGSLAD